MTAGTEARAARRARTAAASTAQAPAELNNLRTDIRIAETIAKPLVIGDPGATSDPKIDHAV